MIIVLEELKYTFGSVQVSKTVMGAAAKPFALYFFTRSRKNETEILGAVPFGGGCINDTSTHTGNPHLPFGGVGESGMGQYHGKASYDTFSHAKGIVKRSNIIDIPLRYPPFKNHLALLKKLVK